MPDNAPQVTAYASLSALGQTRAAIVSALAEGQTGLLTTDTGLPFETVCGVVATPLAPLPEALARHDARITRMAAHLLAEVDEPLARARRRWGSHRIALLLGTSTAGIAATEVAWRTHRATGVVPASYSFSGQHSYDSILAATRKLSGLTGPGWVVSTACSSGAKVIGSALRLIELGVVDAALVGGIDTQCDITLAGFHALGALSPTRCRPFGAGRTGINIGEGGALLLIERAGHDGQAKANVLAVGESSDAHHMSAPHPDGAGARAAMASALAQAGVSAGEVGYVNAHGTGTPLNDAAESQAIRATLGPEVPVSSTKGYTGHMLGAAGAIETVFTIIALEEGWAPLSVGADPVDPALGVNVLLQKTTLTRSLAVSNSFAFGGNNTSVLLGAVS